MRQTRKKLIPLLKLLAGLTLLALVYRSASLPLALMNLSSVRWNFVGLFFVIVLINSFLSSLKWWWTLTRDGVSVSLREIFVSYMIGGFLNLFLPSNIGGDGYRIASVGRGNMLKSAASVVADRLSGLLALTALGTIFAAVSHTRLSHPVAVFLPGILLLILLMVVAALFFPALPRWVMKLTHLDRWAPLRTLCDALFSSFATYRSNPVLLAGLLAISFAFQFLYIVAIYVLARALHIDEVPFASFCVFVPVVAILEAIPISVYGLGLRDAGYLAFFTEVGLKDPQTHAMALSVLYVGLTVLYVMIGGVLLLFRITTRTKPSDFPRQSAL